MSEFISIRSKLDPHEFAYLKDSFGFELQDLETVALVADVSADEWHAHINGFQLASLHYAHRCSI